MTTTLIVIAHPSPSSFTSAWSKASANALRKLGDRILWSDLYALGFDPVETSGHYTLPEVGFDVLKAQENASINNNLPNDVQAEIDKIRQADRIIIHFPVWWFAPPAILKGWCDRVLAHGLMHDVDNRFDRGRFKGKRVLFCASTGADENETAHNGKEGEIEMLLWPLAYTFRYLGFTVLKPRVIHGVHGYFEGADEDKLQGRLSESLLEHESALAAFNELGEITFNKDTDFDQNGQLKSSAPSHSLFIRHSR